jgi:NAD-specific glutamate dehydrogenase
MQTHSESLSLGELCALYAESFLQLRSHARMVFTGDELIRFNERVLEYEQLGVGADDAVTLSLYRRVYVALEVLWCAREYGQDVTRVAQLLSLILDLLGLPPIFAIENNLHATNKWEQELAAGSFQEIRRGLSQVVGTLLQQPHNTPTDVSARLADNRHRQAILSIMTEVQDGMRNKTQVSVSVLPLIARHIRELVRGIATDG